MPDPEDIRCSTAGVDWGFHGPGVMLVAAHDKDDRMFIVSQTYHAKRRIDWWAGQAQKVYDQHPVERFVYDPSEPEHIQKFADSIGPQRHRDVNRIATKANNAWMTGVDLVRDRMDPEQEGGPQIFMVRDSLRFRDPELVEVAAPLCLEDEIPSYVYRLAKDGQPLREQADPLCAQHACDALRYLVMDWWGQDPNTRQLAHVYEHSSWHEVLSHDEVDFDEY